MAEPRSEIAPAGLAVARAVRTLLVAVDDLIENLPEQVRDGHEYRIGQVNAASVILAEWVNVADESGRDEPDDA